MVNLNKLPIALQTAATVDTDVSLSAVSQADIPTNLISMNLCSQEWCQQIPWGTMAEFKEYFDNLSPNVLKVHEAEIVVLR